MTQEPAETRKSDTGPLSLPPEPLMPARPTFWRGPGRWIILAVVVAIIAGVVVLLTRPADPRSDQRPVEVVQGFAAAVAAKDPTKMLSYVEPTIARREIGPEVRAYVEYIDTISFENARYEMVDNDGDMAHVRWTAQMHYQLHELGGGQKDIDTTFELHKIEGAWYLHSVQLPK